MKIIKIEIAKPQAANLPDGVYIGSWRGYKISIHHLHQKYELTTEEGVRGVNINVVVTIKDGEGTFVETKN